MAVSSVRQMRWPLGCQNAEPGETSWNEYRSRADAEPAVVALLGLGPALEVEVELLLRRPGGAVDALEHRPLLVAAPVGTGRAEQLERADLAGAGHVRAAAQVDERALPVEGGRRHVGAVALGGGQQVVDDLDLERLVGRDERGARGLGGLLAELERVVRLDALAHPRLDLRQVLGRQRAREQEVVVEPVGDDRPDARASCPGTGRGRPRPARARRCGASAPARHRPRRGP